MNTMICISTNICNATKNSPYKSTSTSDRKFIISNLFLRHIPVKNILFIYIYLFIRVLHGNCQNIHNRKREMKRVKKQSSRLKDYPPYILYLVGRPTRPASIRRYKGHHLGSPTPHQLPTTNSYHHDK